MSEILNILKKAKDASFKISSLTTEQKNTALQIFAELIGKNKTKLLAANAEDLEEHKGKISAPMYQRLSLSSSKIDNIVKGIYDLIKLKDPANRIIDKTLLDDGLELDKVAVPIGLIGIIFESRPDVVPQVLSLILKSGNAVILKGGREAGNSSNAFMDIVAELCKKCDFLPSAWATLLISREEVHEILKHPEYINLIIPRGSNSLVQNIMENTKIPVMGHADGVCHIYVHKSADLEKALSIITDAKIQYPSACNAVEMILIDEAVSSFRETLSSHLKKAGVELRYPDKEEEYHTEFGDLIINIKTVKNEEEAVSHINNYGSHHTDAILAEDKSAQDIFMKNIDSANVFVNCSTRFSDGFRYGFGAEIGISTSKIHARGPVGLEGLVTYKYIVKGSGQIVATYVGDNAKSFLHKKI